MTREMSIGRQQAREFVLGDLRLSELESGRVLPYDVEHERDVVSDDDDDDDRFPSGAWKLKPLNEEKMLREK